MKNIWIISVILLSFNINIKAQYLDALGLPTNKKTENIVSQDKSIYEISASSIMNIIPSPIHFNVDIAFYNNLIWIEGFNEYYIYGLNPIDGTVEDSIAIDIQKPYGLTYDGQYFWILDNDNLVIEKINPENGVIVDVIDISIDEETYPIGLEVVDNKIFYNDPRSYDASYENDITREITEQGSIIQNYQAAGNFPSGICFDGQYLWSSDNVKQEIHQIDVQTFEVVRTIKAPGGIYPNGLAFDGQFLWVANNDADSIYQIDAGITNICTNILTQNNTKTFLIYPNIVESNFSIDCSNYINDNINIDLINQSGQIISNIFKGKLNTNKIKYEIKQNIQNGLYFCRISTKNSVSIEKLILLH